MKGRIAVLLALVGVMVFVFISTVFILLLMFLLIPLLVFVWLLIGLLLLIKEIRALINSREGFFVISNTKKFIIIEPQFK